MTDDTNTIDQMTQDALNILMRTSPQHARHLEIVLENQLNGKVAEDLCQAGYIIKSHAHHTPEIVDVGPYLKLADRLLSYASNLSLDS